MTKKAIKMFTKAKIQIQPDHQNSFTTFSFDQKHEQGLNEEAIELFLKITDNPDLNPEHNNAKSHAKSICNELEE